METFLEKISSYNILNNFIPGVVLLYLSDKILGINLLVGKQILNLVLIYFIGMTASRIGSLCVEPLFKGIKIIRYADYKDFFAAEKEDSKITVLLEINNLYRTFVGAIVCLFMEFLFVKLCRRCPCFEEFKYVIICVFLLALFAFSYRKQTAYIKKRVEKVCEDKEKGEK